MAARRIVTAITAQLDQLTGFECQFAEMVKAANSRGVNGLSERWDELEHREQKLVADRARIKETIRAAGSLDLLEEIVADIAREERELARLRSLLEERECKRFELHETIPDLSKHLKLQFERLAVESYEFGDFIRRLVPECWVYLVRMCDGGYPLPRARMRFDLAGDFPDHALVPDIKELLTFERTIDLFEHPPAREQCRADVVRLCANDNGLLPKQIRDQLNPLHPDKAITNALPLQGLMNQQNRTTPYDIVLEPPPDLPKLRRHRNPNYKFEPVEGYVRPEL